MRQLLRVVVVAVLAVWAWRYLIRGRRSPERVTVAFSDGSALVLEPGATEFDALAGAARAALS